jgi:hypothetical protein
MKIVSHGWKYVVWFFIIGSRLSFSAFSKRASGLLIRDRRVERRLIRGLKGFVVREPGEACEDHRLDSCHGRRTAWLTLIAS